MSTFPAKKFRRNNIPENDIFLKVTLAARKIHRIYERILNLSIAGYGTAPRCVTAHSVNHSKCCNVRGLQESMVDVAPASRTHSAQRGIL